MTFQDLLAGSVLTKYCSCLWPKCVSEWILESTGHKLCARYWLQRWSVSPQNSLGETPLLGALKIPETGYTGPHWSSPEFWQPQTLFQLNLRKTDYQFPVPRFSQLGPKKTQRRFSKNHRPNWSTTAWFRRAPSNPSSCQTWLHLQNGATAP